MREWPVDQTPAQSWADCGCEPRSQAHIEVGSGAVGGLIAKMAWTQVTGATLSQRWRAPKGGA